MPVRALFPFVCVCINMHGRILVFTYTHLCPCVCREINERYESIGLEILKRKP